MAKLGKYILASRIMRNMLAEKAEEARKFGEGENEDPQLKKITDENPPKVEDKTKTAKGVAKAKETTPKGKGVPKSPSDKDLKPSKYTDMTNYVPANIKRNKDEVPTAKFNFDDDDIEGNVNVFPKKGDELEKHFDKKHIIKLKETMSEETLKELSPETYQKYLDSDRVKNKWDRHPRMGDDEVVRINKHMSHAERRRDIANGDVPKWSAKGTPISVRNIRSKIYVDSSPEDVENHRRRRVTSGLQRGATGRELDKLRYSDPPSSSDERRYVNKHFPKPKNEFIKPAPAQASKFAPQGKTDLDIWSTPQQPEPRARLQQEAKKVKKSKGGKKAKK